MDDKTLSTEQKIDYIYTTLKAQQRNARISGIIKWGFRLFILGYLYYFFMIGLPNMFANIIPEIPNILQSSQTTESGIGGMLQSEKIQEFLDTFTQK